MSDNAKIAASARTRAALWIQTHFHLTAILVLAAGLALRLYEAWGTFLNPDEALHYFVANRSSWADAYQASLTMAHPPLMIFILYWWRALGNSEFMLRLPAVLTGTAFCWMFFKWLTQVFGKSVGMAGLVLSALLPSLSSLSSEVRQYEWMLLFAISAAYLLEQAMQQQSSDLLLVSAIFLYLAMLSHYSAFLFAAALAVYSAWYIARQFSRSMLYAWIIAQTGALAIAALLYVTHISKIKGSGMAEQAFDYWLYRSYFHAGHGNWLVFAVARTFSVFQFIFEQVIVGDIATLIFIAGVVCLLLGKISPIEHGPSVRQMATFLVLPFVLNCATGLLDVYPYGGTRHAAFLAIFGLTGISLMIAKLAGPRTEWALGIALAVVVLCAMVRPERPRYLTRAEHPKEQMEEALKFVHSQIPLSDPILADYETSVTLSYYLCDQKPVATDDSITGFVLFRCGGRRIISADPDLWVFWPGRFPALWNRLLRNAGLQPGQTVWVSQAGWLINLASGLQSLFPQFQNLQTWSFGHHIQFFKLIVGQPMPDVGTPH